MVSAAPGAERRFEVRGPMWHRLLCPFIEGRWRDIPREQCWWGPAGTAKTMSTFIVIDTILRDPRFEGVRILWLRKTQASCKQSSLVTFEEQVLQPTDPILRGPSRMQRESYVYRRPGRHVNELVIAGMNVATRHFGTEFDMVICEEAIEFELRDIETLWRAMRPRTRGLGLPFKTVIHLTNPDSEFHWLYKRMEQGRCASFFVGIECNPSYYDLQTGMPTAAGREYLADLRSQMQDERYARLVEGRWVSAEGQILKTFGKQHLTRGHIVREPYRWDRWVPLEPHRYIPNEGLEIRWYFASIDFGDRNPGALEVWGVTRTGMPIRVAEVYHTDRDIQWWAGWCSDFYGEFGLRAIVCDSANPKHIDYINDLIARTYKLEHIDVEDEYREQKRVAPRIAVPCEKNNRGDMSKSNVVLLRYGFGLDHGRPRMLLGLDTERIVDRTLVRDSQPTGLIEEIPGWTWAKHDPRIHTQGPREVPDPSRPDHGLDSTAYALAFLWGRDLSRDPQKDMPKHPPGSYAAMRRHVPWIKADVKKRMNR